MSTTLYSCRAAAAVDREHQDRCCCNLPQIDTQYNWHVYELLACCLVIRLFIQSTVYQDPVPAGMPGQPAQAALLYCHLPHAKQQAAVTLRRCAS